MWDLYPDIGVEVARLNWVGDGITWNEEFVLEELSYVVSEDPELVRAVVNQEHRSYLLEVGSGSAERAADYPWLTDDVNALELWTIIGIARIAERNPGYAERVLGYTWLADGINEAEARGLGALSRWALLAPELVDRVLKYSWLDDGITDAEGGVLSVLHTFAERGGVEAAKQVMDYQWLADGVTWDEHELIAELESLVADDPEAARQISRGALVPYLLGLVSESPEQAADYPWLTDGVNAMELRTIIEIARIAERNPGFAELVLGYTWLADGITEVEARGLGALSRWALLAPELVDRVLKYTWLDDGIAHYEGYVLASLYDFVEIGGVDAAAQVMDYQWLADGVTWEEVLLIAELKSLVADDPEAARQISRGTLEPYLLELVFESANEAADYPWLADGANVLELQALIEIARIAERNPGFAERVLGYTWLADGINEAEALGLDALSGWALQFPELVDRVLKYTWLGDGITHSEGGVLYALRAFAERGGVEATKQVMDYQWLADGVTWDEHDLIAELESLVADDPEAAIQISRGTLELYLLGLVSDSAGEAADYPWLADGVNARELRTIIGIAGIAKQAQELAERLLGYSWLADGVSQRESYGISSLAFIARSNLELAQLVVGMGILDDPLRDRDLYAIISLNRSLNRLIETDNVALLTSQPWFADGLNDEETAFVAVTNRDRYSDSQYRDFLRAHFTRSATISLPLAGDVDVWVFWHNPFPDSDDTIELIEDAARASEALIGVPFPTTDIILLFGDYGTLPSSGYHDGNYMVIEREAGNERGVVYHETAHYYSLGVNSWLNEGFANFVAIHTLDRLGISSLGDRVNDLEEHHLPRCAEEGFQKIQQLWDYVDYDDLRGCQYELGEHFLISLFELLGEEAMSAALRELYLLSEMERRDQSEEDFYRIFLKHTPLGLEDEFRDLYRRLHGGPYADGER